jgi:hypothetical protein
MWLKRLSDGHEQRLTPLARGLYDLSICPDYVVNRGHYFGTDLTDADKRALIEFLKTL